MSKKTKVSGIAEVTSFLSHATDVRGYHLFAQGVNRTHYYAQNISLTNHRQVFKLWREQGAREEGSIDGWKKMWQAQFLTESGKPSPLALHRLSQAGHQLSKLSLCPAFRGSSKLVQPLPSIASIHRETVHENSEEICLQGGLYNVHSQERSIPSVCSSQQTLPRFCHL